MKRMNNEMKESGTRNWMNSKKIQIKWLIELKEKFIQIDNWNKKTMLDMKEEFSKDLETLQNV
jgi:hypothetical protein